MLLLQLKRAVFVAFVLISGVAQAAEVELLNSFTIDMSKYGFKWRTEVHTVAVDNISPVKKVYIRREKDDGTWVDIPMYYLSSAGQGKEIWRVTTNDSSFADEFVVMMEADGVSYWDNNDGQNYQFQEQGYLLGKSVAVSLDSPTLSSGYPSGENQIFRSNIVVKNLAPTKNVRVIYSLDNWATQSEEAATYAGNPMYYGYGSYPNPNLNGAELWRASFTIPYGAKGQYYLAYDVNGTTYYDSNYGQNYKINPESEYESMYLRSSFSWNAKMPMTLVDDNLWAVNFDIQETSLPMEFKFDVFGDWVVNYGDHEGDGIAELDGQNILITETGSIRILFNNQSKRYYLQPFGL